MTSELPAFGIEVKLAEGAAVVALTGELDLATAPQLRDQLVALAGGGFLAVTLDLAALDFMDSTGLSVLVAGLKHLRERGGDLVLRSPQPGAMKVLEITGLNAVFAIA